MDAPVTLLCLNPSEDAEKRLEQGIMCAIIEGYTDATAELSRYITKLYKDKDPNASLIYSSLAPLVEQQNKHYDILCKELNNI